MKGTVASSKRPVIASCFAATFAIALVAGCGASEGPGADESGDESALSAALTPAESSLVKEAQRSPEMARHLETLRAFGWKVPTWKAATVQHATAQQLAAMRAEHDAPTMVVRMPVTSETAGARHTVDVLYAGKGMALFRPADKASAARLQEVLNEAQVAKLPHLMPAETDGLHPDSLVENENAAATSPYWYTWWVYKIGAFWACWNSDNWEAAYFATEFVVGTGQGWIRTWDGCAWSDPGRWTWSTHWATCGFISRTCSGYPVTLT